MTKLFALITIAGLTIATLAWLITRRTTPSPTPTSSTGQALTPEVQMSVSATSSISPASTTAPSSSYSIEPSPTRGWKILKVDQYKFQISYPQSWLLTQNVTDIADNPYPARYIANLVSRRRIVTDDFETVPTVIAVYDGPSIPLPQWLNKAYQTDLSSAEKGGIGKALAESYAHEGGPVYDESQKSGTSFYGIGLPGPALFYTTYIARRSSKYVYAIEIHLPLGPAGEPSTSAFVQAYKQIVSSFRFTD